MAIFSTVRDGKKHGSIGFVADERRVNVGLTRARSSLIVIGNAKALKTDERWGNLVKQAMQDGSVCVPLGCHAYSIAQTHLPLWCHACSPAQIHLPRWCHAYNPAQTHWPLWCHAYSPAGIHHYLSSTFTIFGLAIASSPYNCAGCWTSLTLCITCLAMVCQMLEQLCRGPGYACGS